MALVVTTYVRSEVVSDAVKPVAWVRYHWRTIGLILGACAFAGALYGGAVNIQQGHQIATVIADAQSDRVASDLAGCERGNTLRADLVENDVELVRTVIVTLGEDPNDARYTTLLQAVRTNAAEKFPPVDCRAVTPGG